MVEDVAARSGGVPLFVEEVTRLLLERGEQGGGIHAIPPTLQQSLMARLDRLGPAREVAQIGAVIGRGFSYGLLRDVAEMEGVSLQAALEKLADADIVLVQGLPPESDYRFKHALIQDAAYENLLKSRRQVLHRRVAEILRDRFADTAAAEPEALAYHFTQAGMTDAAIEWWGKAGDQALRRSAFQEAIAHLGKAIEMADKESDGAPRAAAPTSASERLKLQTSYGRAMMWSKGYAAPETAAAFARAQQLSQGSNAGERFVTYYGQWGVKLLSAELNTAREIAEVMLREAGLEAKTSEALAAHRLVALVRLCSGAFTDARTHSERALMIDDSGWDRDAKLRFGQDLRIAAFCYLGLSCWTLGEVGSARPQIESAIAGAVESAHVPTLANTYCFAAMFDLFRSDTQGVLRAAKPTVEFSRQHALSLYLAIGKALCGWANARLGDHETGLEELRHALRDLADQGNKLWLPLYQGLLAQIESDGHEVEQATATIGDAVALADQIGGYWATAFLHRIRGEILLKRDPANTAPAEEAFLTAIGIAQQQKAKSFELRAALSLAKLFQSTGRAADAHAVLAPALEGFSPTPEFPEIEQAQALLAALAATDEVKNADAARERRLKLQTAYGNALISARGYQAPETTAAFARARELAAGIEDASERFSVFYGQWAGSFVRAELPAMRELAHTLLSETRPQSPEAGIAHRLSGETEWFAGNLVDARGELERALELFDSERDRELAFRFGQDAIVTATAFLATVVWPLGEIDRGRALVHDMVAQAVRGRHIPTIVWARVVAAIFELMCRNPSRAALHMPELIGLANEHGMKLWIAFASFLDPWARAGADCANLEDMRSGLEMLRQQGVLLYRPIFATVLAEAEMHSGAIDTALATVDAAIADTELNGQRWFEAETHRTRGEILLKRDPANTAPAEEAFLTAIAIAQQQKARSFELRAALSLAKLYQSTRRAADAHAVLAPALEGFSPTPEFPEIEQAQALLAALAATDELKNAAAARQRRLKLQVGLANALLQSRGQHASETKSAFDKARELASGIDDPLQRFSTYYGLWVGGYVRGERATMIEAAEALLKEAESRPVSAEASIAHRIYGVTCWIVGGDAATAREHLEMALALYRPERDRELAHRFAQDIGVSARAYLSLVLCVLGESDQARIVMADAMSLAAETKHAPTLVYANYHAAFLEMLRLDPIRAKYAAETCLALAREHGVEVWTLLAPPMVAWANADCDEMHRSLSDCRERDIWLAAGMGRSLLAAGQAAAGQLESALATADEAIAEAEQRGLRFFEAETHRIRGEILLKLNPANTAPAEEAFLTAIAIAQEQKARSFELRAALSLAKLYQSTNRAADAHAVLVPALEGFAPTPEFPEIAEAQTLLAALAETDDVKNAAAARQRRLKLQTSYAQAMMLSRGFGAEETRAAFRQAQGLSANVANATERFDTYYGLWVSSLLRGDLALARETAETFLREANSAARATEAGVANRNLGMTCLFQGNLLDARKYLEEALRIYNPERDRDAKFRFGADPGTAAGYLSHVNWLLGDVERARELIGTAIACSVASEHAPTVAYVHHMDATLGILRRDAEATLRVAQAQVELSRQHQMSLYLSWGLQSSGWARAGLGDRESGLQELAQALDAYLAQGNKIFVPLYQVLRAEHEAEEQTANVALNRIDQALALANQTGEHWSDAFLHLLRGEILLKRDPANTAPAEEAFLNAIAIAQQQKAKSFELRAALSLAKLYQSTGRAAAAHAVLSPALEGFSRMPEFPEIGEAQALLASLE